MQELDVTTGRLPAPRYATLQWRRSRSATRGTTKRRRLPVRRAPRRRLRVAQAAAVRADWVAVPMANDPPAS